MGVTCSAASSDVISTPDKRGLLGKAARCPISNVQNQKQSVRVGKGFFSCQIRVIIYDYRCRYVQSRYAPLYRFRPLVCWPELDNQTPSLGVSAPHPTRWFRVYSSRFWPASADAKRRREISLTIVMTTRRQLTREVGAHMSECPHPTTSCPLFCNGKFERGRCRGACS